LLGVDISLMIKHSDKMPCLLETERGETFLWFLGLAI
jgi:hypothetical protein